MTRDIVLRGVVRPAQGAAAFEAASELLYSSLGTWLHRVGVFAFIVTVRKTRVIVEPAP